MSQHISIYRRPPQLPFTHAPEHLPGPQGILVGVALYLLQNQGISFYHWALVVHPKSYSASDVRIYEISNRDFHGHPTAWYTYQGNELLRATKEFIGVVHIDTISTDDGMSMMQLKEFLASCPPDADGYDTCGRGWSGAAYVERSFTLLEEAGLISLSCPSEELYLMVLTRGAELESIPRTTSVPVVKL